MNKNLSVRSLPIQILVGMIVCLSVVLSSPAFGAPRVWSGSNASGNWSLGGVGGNWTSLAAPVAADTLTFDGSNHLTDNNNNLTADLSLGAITFASTAGAFTLAGNRITLGGTITNSGANTQTINLDMILSATRSITATSGDITVGGVISGTGFGVTATGSGHVVTLTGGNSYTGVTTISAGATLSTNNLDNIGSNSGIGKGDATSTATNQASLVINNSTFKYTGGVVSTDRLFTVGTTGGTIDSSGSGALTFSNTGALLSSTNAARALILTGSTGGTLNPTWDNALGVGVNTLTKNGAGTWVLAGNNGYTGATTINLGTLTLNGTNASATYTVAGGTLNTGANERIVDTATVNVTGGTFDLQARTETIGQITTLTGGTITGSSGNNLILAGVANTTTATGTNSIAANLQLTAAASAGATARTFTETGSSDTLTISGNITEASGKAGSIVKSGSGTLVLSGNNAFTGGTTLNAGTLKLASASALGAAGSNIAMATLGGMTLQYASDSAVNAYNVSTGVASSGIWNVVLDRATAGTAVNQTLASLSMLGASSQVLNVTTATNSNINDGTTPTLTITALTAGSAGRTIHLGGNATYSIGSITGAAVASVDSNVVSLDGTSASNQVTGVISNSGAGATLNTTSVIVNGPGGLWTFSGANTFTGTLSVNNSGKLTLDYAGAGAGTNSNYVLGAGATNTVTFLGAGNLEFKGKAGGGNTTNQTIGSITVGYGSNIHLNTGLSTIVLNKNGGAALNVTAGAIDRKANTVLLIDQSSGGSLTTSTSLTVGANTNGQILVKDNTGRIDFAANTGANTATIAANATTVLTSGVAGGTTNYKLDGSLVVGADTTTKTVRANTTTTGQSLDLGASHNLYAAGLLFVGANDYEIKGTGTSRIATSNAANAGASIEHFGTGKLTLSAFAGAGTGPNTFVGNGSNLIDLNSTSNLTPTSATTGTTTFSDVTLRLSNSGAIDLSNTAGNAIGTGLVVMGSNAILELVSGNLTRNLGTATGGSLNMAGTSGGFSAFGADRTVNLQGGAALTWNTTAGFLLDGATLILGSNSSTHTVDFQNAINLGALTRTVEARDGANAGAGGAAIDGKLSGVLSGTAGFIKTGTGTLELTNNSNSYGGVTTVSAGTLLANNTTGSATGSGSVTVGASGTLGGTGIISGAVTVNGTLAAGASAGKLTVNNNVSLDNGSKFSAEINGIAGAEVAGTHYDQLEVGGAGIFSLTGTNDLVLTLTGTANLAVGEQFTLALVQGTNTANSIGEFDLLNGVASSDLGQGDVFTLGSTQFRISYQAEGATFDAGIDGNDLMLEVVPEPTSMAMLLGGVAFLCVGRRGRRLTA